MNDFILAFLVPFYKTKKSLEKLLHERRILRISLLLILLLGLFYTFTVFMGYKNGFGAVLKPFVNIPAEEYYLWESFFCLPVFFAMAILFAGTSRLLAIAFKGEGSFEKTISVFGISLMLPMLVTMWLPETILIVFFPSQKAFELGGFNFFPLWVDIARQIAGILWPLAIMVIGISVAEKLNFAKSTAITILSFIPAAIFMILFIR